MTALAQALDVDPAMVDRTLLLDLARTTAIVVPSIPILSLGASFLLLGEVASAREWAGLLLCVGGVSIFVTAPHAAGSFGDCCLSDCLSS